MVAKYDIFKCNDCGYTIMALDSGDCELVCCSHKMVHTPEQTADSSTEKHVPIIEKVDDGYKVTVGSTLHPMLEKHWIQWIELVVNGKRMMAELNPGDEPTAFFCCPCEGQQTISAREYCNLHGLWRGEL